MSRRARKISVKPQSGLSSEINVTPLVDVVLVLLIIFMVVTPLLEKDIDVRVPEQEQVELETVVPPDQLVVSVGSDGVFKLNSEALLDGDYVPRLARAVAARPRGERVVFFVADRAASYGRLVAALDGAKQAGAETLGMMTDEL